MSPKSRFILTAFFVHVVIFREKFRTFINNFKSLITIITFSPRLLPFRKGVDFGPSYQIGVISARE